MIRTIAILSLLVSVCAADAFAARFSRDCRREQSIVDGRTKALESTLRGIDNVEMRRDYVLVRNEEALARYDDRIIAAAENIELAKDLRASRIDQAEDKCMERRNLLDFIGGATGSNALCRGRSAAVQSGNRLVAAREAYHARLVKSRPSFVKSLNRRVEAVNRSVKRSREVYARYLKALNEAKAILEQCLNQLA